VAPSATPLANSSKRCSSGGMSSRAAPSAEFWFSPSPGSTFLPSLLLAGGQRLLKARSSSSRVLPVPDHSFLPFSSSISL
jgi:hypothetical protein